MPRTGVCFFLNNNRLKESIIILSVTYYLPIAQNRAAANVFMSNSGITMLTTIWMDLYILIVKSHLFAPVSSNGFFALSIDQFLQID